VVGTISLRVLAQSCEIIVEVKWLYDVIKHPNL
jgi:hypothetical protein